MKKLGFVILHYQVVDKTTTCIDSIIKRIDTENYEIIVVDNASPNNSGNVLLRKYKNNSKIHILLNKENLGFSGGNNIGFKYAKYELKCEYIAMINNDTYLIQDDFFKVILDEYDKSRFAVLGPKIITNSTDSCLPDGKLITVEKQKKYLRNLKIKLFLNYLKLDILIKKIKQNKRKNEKLKEELNLEKRKENVVLHGCCLIFSPDYINKFDGIEQKTFLYCEEEFLYIRLIRNGMLSVYNPKLLIYHDEASATNQINNDSRIKDRFVYKNLIKANEILKKDLQELRKDNYEPKY